MQWEITKSQYGVIYALSGYYCKSSPIIRPAPGIFIGLCFLINTKPTDISCIPILAVCGQNDR